MTNHIHLVAVPTSDDGLQKMLKPLHMRYAQRINQANGWKGHLWQGRFFSSPLDEAYLWAAVRYVERNPVRAGMLNEAEAYPWSSAAVHCARTLDNLIKPESAWSKLFSEIEDWSAWLAEGDEAEELRILRRNIDKSLPCGSESFVEKLGRQVDRVLAHRPQGRPKKTADKTNTKG